MTTVERTAQGISIDGYHALDFHPDLVDGGQFTICTPGDGAEVLTSELPETQADFIAKLAEAGLAGSGSLVAAWRLVYDNLHEQREVAQAQPQDTRPRIDLADELHQKVDAGWAALVKASDEHEPPVLVRGNELVRMTERGELEPYGEHSLRERLSRVALFGRQTQNAGWVTKDPPLDVVRALLARDSAEYEGVPCVDRVVDVPVLAANGELVARPGLHRESRLFFRPATELRDVGPGEVDTISDVTGARDLLMHELLGDFAFADDASRANALGLLLLPFVREFIGDAPTPLHVVLAPEPGTGKTYLTQAALLPACGVVAAMAGAKDEDEWRKRITATLLRGAQVIFIDNLRHGLDSGALSAALTTGIWRDRVLGHSREAVLPVRSVWVATGNNMELSDELARRAVPIRLDPGEVRPANRPKSDYRHPDLLRWAGQRRAELVCAALTLVRHWLEGEVYVTPGSTFARVHEATGLLTRAESEQTLGSFEHWARVVGGIVRAADVPGFLGNRELFLAETNWEEHELLQFLEAWHTSQPGPLELGGVVDMCHRALRNDLPTELMVRDGQLRRALTYWLRGHRDRRVGGHMLKRTDERPPRWLVRRT